MAYDFKVGSLWATKAGHKVIILDIIAGVLIVYFYSNGYKFNYNAINGCRIGDGGSAGYQLIAPWVEPSRGTVYLGICGDGTPVRFESKKTFDEFKGEFIASYIIHWVEGQKDWVFKC